MITLFSLLYLEPIFLLSFLDIDIFFKFWLEFEWGMVNKIMNTINYSFLRKLKYFKNTMLYIILDIILEKYL